MNVNTNRINGELFEELLNYGALNLQANIQKINDLNVFPVPDGDTGSNMYSTLIGGIEYLKKCDKPSLDNKAEALAEGMLLNARGNSGVILSQLFYGTAQGLLNKTEVTVREFCKALKMGVGFAYKAVVTPVEGTILTVAREAVDRVGSAINDNMTVETFFKEYLRELRISLDNTPELLAVLKESNVVDSGGAGLVCLVEGICKAIVGDLALEETAATVDAVDLHGKSFENSEINYGYCTEVLLQLLESKCEVHRFDEEELKIFLVQKGDSVVAVRSGNNVKIHVHTMRPSEILDYCQRYGEFISVKIENMTVQHNNILMSGRELEKKKPCTIVAVASGDGFAELYKEFGADYIVRGDAGNPSIEQFIESFDKVNSETVIVLPNNKNIILAAKQAANLHKKSKVIVLSTKTPQQVYSALMVVTDKNNVAMLLSDMEQAMLGVESYSVTYAVRDANLGGIEIQKNDYLAFKDGDLLLDDKNKIECFKRMLESVESIENKEIITVFYGKSVTADDKKAIGVIVDNLCPSAEFVEYDGKQDVYPFLVAIE